MGKNKPLDPVLCLCNKVSQSKVVNAVDKGARKMDEIFDQTTAGVGPCGGSCRPYLQKLLDLREAGEPIPDNIRKAK